MGGSELDLALHNGVTAQPVRPEQSLQTSQQELPSTLWDPGQVRQAPDTQQWWALAQLFLILLERGSYCNMLA